jgi:HSP20 family protein
MNLVRFDAFRELEEMSTRLNKFFGPSLRRQLEVDGFTDWAPATDVQETDKEYLLKADLPEVQKDDIKVGIEDGILTVQGERKQEKEEKNKKFHRIERSYGKFVRRFTVPLGIDESKVSAEFKDGVLNVRLPKSAAVKPHGLDVKVA